MQRSYEQHSIFKLFKERNFAVSVSVMLLLSNLLLAVLLFQKREKIIVIPATLKESFWVKGNEVSKEYLAEMTDYFASKLLNVSADNIEYNWQMAMKYVDPSFVGELNKRLIGEKERLSVESLSSSFRTQALEVNESKGSVKIKGIMTKYVADQRITQDLECFVASYQESRGIILLSAFEECDDD